MDNVPYEEWCGYLVSLLRHYGCKDGLLLDLGCGTGTLTELLDSAGYNMIGVDVSEDMLSVAMDKRAESGKDILYLLQDMREFELYGTVAGVVSICDSMNYLTDPEDLITVFKLVNNYLDPGGYFIFDLNTRYKYEQVMGSCTIAEDRGNAAFIWENEFDPETSLNYYSLALFMEDEDGRYIRFDEEHVQRAYFIEEICSAAEAAGMKFIAAYDAFTMEPPKADSERIYIVLREQGKR
ncbi:MAG: class I SAM-dependent methyltransferase [Lachnospiraceae bacterium]|nr:class I SAM-dependent methyltransferase [Lachnospiraceae bacterium]